MMDDIGFRHPDRLSIEPNVMNDIENEMREAILFWTGGSNRQEAVKACYEIHRREIESKYIDLKSIEVNKKAMLEWADKYDKAESEIQKLKEENIRLSKVNLLLKSGLEEKPEILRDEFCEALKEDNERLNSANKLLVETNAINANKWKELQLSIPELLRQQRENCSSQFSSFENIYEDKYEHNTKLYNAILNAPSPNIDR